MVGRFVTPSMLVMVPNNSGRGDKLSFLLVEGNSSSLFEQIESPLELLQPITKVKFLCYHATFRNPSVAFVHSSDAHHP
jgi:hypothetical protein